MAESDIKQTVECEVLVVGAGSSGSFAAAAAAEAGAKTILIEKFGHDMASGIRDTLAACGSKQQQEDGDDVNKKGRCALPVQLEPGLYPSQPGTGVGRPQR